VPEGIARRLREGDLTAQGFTSLGFLRVDVAAGHAYVEIWVDGSHSIVGSVSATAARASCSASFATYQGTEEEPRGIAVNARPRSRVNRYVRPGTHQLCLPGSSQLELLDAHRGQRVSHLTGMPLLFTEIGQVKAIQDRIHELS
jgi:hypothetical protein